jgi:type IV secretory pathway TrbL component
MPLTRLLNAFLGNFVTSMGLLTPTAWAILTFFLGIELSWIGLQYMMDGELNPRPLIAKVVTANVIGFALLNWPFLVKQFINMWVGWGLQGSLGKMQLTDFTDPDNVAKFGFAATGVIFRHLAQYTAWEQIKNILEIWTSGGAAFLVILFYFGLGAWVMVTLLEFYAGAVVTVLLLPWGVSGLFAWVAERAIAHMVASGIRVFVLAYLLGVALPIMETLIMTTPTNAAIPLLGPTFVQALNALAGAMALCMLCWRAGAFAMGFSVGGPQLSPRDMTQFVTMLTTQVTRLGGAIDAMTAQLGIGETPGRRI